MSLRDREFNAQELVLVTRGEAFRPEPYTAHKIGEYVHMNSGGPSWRIMAQIGDQLLVENQDTADWIPDVCVHRADRRVVPFCGTCAGIIGRMH